MGRVELQSNVELFIAPNSTIQGSGNTKHWHKRSWDFPKGCEGMSNPSAGPRGGVFFARHASNFRITGGGVVDGAGSIFNSDSSHRSCMFVFVQCSDVLVDNLRIQNSSAWTLVPMFSQRLVFRNLHISEGDGHGHNTDGFDPWASSDVQFLDSYYAAGDDCVAIKSGKQINGVPSAESCPYPAENILVNNITCAHSHGLTIGSEVSSGVRNVTISNINIFNSGPPVRVKTQCGRGAYVRDIRYENITAHDVEYGVWVDQAYGHGPLKCNKTGTTVFSNIVVHNLTAHTISKDAFLILGLHVKDSTPGYSPIQDLHLQDVSLSGYKHVGSCTLANVTTSGVISPPLPDCS